MSTQLTGRYSDCGLENGFSSQTTCKGPNCGILLSFPAFTCQNNSGTVTCTNGITCSTSPAVGVIDSNFTLNQVGSIVVQDTQLQVANDSFSAIRTVTATASFTGQPSIALPTLTPRRRLISSSGKKSTTPNVILRFLTIILVFTSLVHAQTTSSPAQIAQNIFSELPSIPFIQNAFRAIALSACESFVSGGARAALLAAGDVVTQELKEAEGTLILDCQELVEAVLVEDPPLEFLMMFAGRILCTKLVSTIMQFPFNELGDEVCQAISSITNPTSTPPPAPPPPTQPAPPPTQPAPPPTQPAPPPSQCTACLAPVCICPEDNGLPPRCGSGRDPTCNLCTCPMPTTTTPPPTTTTTTPPPARTTTTPSPTKTTTTPSPTKTTTTPTPTKTTTTPSPTKTTTTPSPTKTTTTPSPTKTTTTQPPTPPAPPPSKCTACLAPVCICPEDKGLPPRCGTVRDPTCNLCTC